MRTLKVKLDYGSSTSPQPQRGSDQGIALPVRVLEAQGTALAEGVATLEHPAEVELPDNYEIVFVRLTWPSGKTKTQKVVLKAQGITEVTFSDTDIARNAWSAWAVPRLNPMTSLATPEESSNMSIERYAKVWLQLWRFIDGQWRRAPMVPRMQYRSEVARQIDLDLVAAPHLLQIGGSNVPWRFVALPGAGPCRILLTPNESKDPRADPLKVIVTGFRSDAETILEFMARDSVRAANTLVNSETIARELFEEKFNDPIAAVAGAYYLLRTENWERVPLYWWENLSSNFIWIPDTAILHCMRLLRAGLENKEAITKALDLFKYCLDRGWPVYEEGLQLLQEANSLLRLIANREDAGYFARVDTLATAKVWSGSALSFYGREPAKPSSVLWVGSPDAPRRQHLASAGWVHNYIKSIAHISDDTTPLTTSDISRIMGSLSFAREFAPTRLKKHISLDSLATGDKDQLTRSKISEEIITPSLTLSLLSYTEGLHSVTPFIGNIPLDTLGASKLRNHLIHKMPALRVAQKPRENIVMMRPEHVKKNDDKDVGWILLGNIGD